MTSATPSTPPTPAVTRSRSSARRRPETASRSTRAPSGSRAGSPFDLGKLKRNKKKGTAKLEVTGLRTAGELKLSGKGLKTQRKSAGPGSAKLKLKPKGKLAKNLKRKGKAKVKAKVVFTPNGGDAAQQNDKVKLKRKRKHR